MASVSLLLLVGLLSLWIELTPISGLPERCLHPVDPGKCYANLPRYYYDHNHKRCKKFIYGGCEGNSNNFESLKECVHLCKEKPGECPKPPEGTITICPVLCKHDWECTGKQKCCPYGCKIQCMEPV